MISTNENNCGSFRTWCKGSLKGFGRVLCPGVDYCHELADGFQEDEKHIVETVRHLVPAPPGQHQLVHLGRPSLQREYRLVQPAPYPGILCCSAEHHPCQYGPPDALDWVCNLLHLLLVDGHALYWSSSDMLLPQTC